MSCEICGRSNCAKSFHSRDAVDEFDKIADDIKDRMKSILVRKIDRLETFEFSEDKTDIQYVILKDVIDIIEDYS